MKIRRVWFGTETHNHFPQFRPVWIIKMHFANLLDVLKVIVCFKKVTASICITAVERGSFFSPHIWNVNALKIILIYFIWTLKFVRFIHLENLEAKLLLWLFDLIFLQFFHLIILICEFILCWISFLFVNRGFMDDN